MTSWTVMTPIPAYCGNRPTVTLANISWPIVHHRDGDEDDDDDDDDDGDDDDDPNDDDDDDIGSKCCRYILTK